MVTFSNYLEPLFVGSVFTLGYNGKKEYKFRTHEKLGIFRYSGQNGTDYVLNLLHYRPHGGLIKKVYTK